MSAQPIIIRPGINTQTTILLNETGFSQSQLIRFLDGLCQKLGGWAKFFPDPVLGICRGIFANQDLDGNQYLAIGTTEVLDVYINGAIYNITPVSSEVDLSMPFTTIMGSTDVSVESVASGAAMGDPIYIMTPTAVGGIILQGFYFVDSITDPDNYIITSTTPALSSASSAGDTALFTTTNTSATVQVTLVNHGFQVGDPYTVYVSTTVATIDIFGNYSVNTVIDADNFTIVTASAANADDTGSENGGEVRIQYLLPAGPVDAIPASGYGVGTYGEGFYGFGNSTGTITPPRQWHFGPWGGDLIANYTNGGIYVWIASNGPISNPATIISEAPTMNTSIFIAMPQQQIVAVGAQVGDVQDPLLVRWCEVADYTDWTASPTNQAGSFRIPRGSRIVGGLQGPQQGLIWTDQALWAMQYVQPPFVYGFNEIGSGCGLIGSRAMGTLNSQVLWMGTNGFFSYAGGGVVSIPCSVWDKVFQNLNTAQVEKITCAPNSSFNEMSWYFPSASGSGEVDMYVKYNSVNGVWDYGILDRTAWIDQSIFGQPIGVNTSSYIQQHEISNDADGIAMVSSVTTGLFRLSDGDIFIFVERMIPDFILSTGATVNITVYMYNYQTDVPVAYGPFPCTSSTEYIIVRGRGRFASLEFESQDISSFWRIGLPIYYGSPAGRR